MHKTIYHIFLFLLLISTYAFSAEKYETATFAGGCFWCMEPPFEKYQNKGVIKTVAGYTGGDTINPTYREVSTGKTGHAEAVQVTYDPNKITYEKLLDIYWHNIDPTVKNRQFCDTGSQYRSAIFYHNEQQKKLAIRSKESLSKKFPVIYTEIKPIKGFYLAEEYHQNYYQKNPWRYKFYRYSCGRDKRLKEVWEDK